MIYNDHCINPNYMTMESDRKNDSYTTNTAIILSSLIVHNCNNDNDDFNYDYKQFNVISVTTPRNIIFMSDLESGALVFMYI